MSPSPPACVRLEMPWLTILKILSAAALVWIWLQVWPIVMVVLVSLVLAVALEPIVEWLERHGFTPGLAVLAVGVVTLVMVGAFVFAAAAPFTSQSKQFAASLASFQES